MECIRSLVPVSVNLYGFVWFHFLSALGEVSTNRHFFQTTPPMLQGVTQDSGAEGYFGGGKNERSLTSYRKTFESLLS
jgi:hypothetical protein